MFWGVIQNKPTNQKIYMHLTNLNFCISKSMFIIILDGEDMFVEMSVNTEKSSNFN